MGAHDHWNAHAFVGLLFVIWLMVVLAWRLTWLLLLATAWLAAIIVGASILLGQKVWSWWKPMWDYHSSRV